MPRTIDNDHLPVRASRGQPVTAWGRKHDPRWLGLLFALIVSVTATVASAEVRLDGDWPSTEQPVSLSVANKPRAAAIRQLAEQAGWSVVLASPAPEPVDLLVHEQPPAKVLEALLRDGSWTAHREGTLVTIARASTDESKPQAAPPGPIAPAAPSAAPPVAPTGSPSVRAKDRFAAGSSVTVKAGETVRDLAVMGGTADVYGTVAGDLVVFGGTATVHPGGHVAGDGAVFGGSLNIEKGGAVDGDQVAFGGTVRKDGEVVSGFPLDSGWHPPKPLSSRSIAARFAHGVAHAALLFLFGAILVAIAAKRMEVLQVAFAAHPLRSLLHGLLAGLVLVLATVILAVTCIGIPIAAALLLASFVAGSAGLCAVLATVGTALARHRSENPYLHLAIGCGLYALIGVLPVLGGIATFLLGAAGLGLVVSTRGAGLWASPSPE